MPRRLLLFAALLCLKLPVALAQRLPVQSRWPGGYEASGLARPVPALPPGPAATPLAAPIPTVRAAASLPPPALAQPFDQPLPAAALPQPPRYDQTGVLAAPPYSLYQNWPEAQRKYTLPAPYTEPLPVQLLRGILGR